VPYLEKVGVKAQDYPRAQYLLGLISFQDETLDVAQKVRRASEGFQNAVVAGEAMKNQGVVDLAYLSLARLAYEYRQYDAAIYYYRKISKNSPKIARAFYESGWTYFLKGDISRALGVFHALHSPYFRHQFYPELWILEATVYVQNCYVDYANEAIKRFEEDVLVLGPPLRDFLKRHTRPEQFYEAIVAAVNTPRTAALPRNLISPVLQNVEFYNIYKTIKQIEMEEAKIKAQLQRLGPFGQELLSKLGQLRSERIAEAGVVVQRTLRGVEKDINLFQDKLTELRLDLQEQELERANAEIDRLEKKGEQAETKPGVEQQGSVAIAGSDAMVWPFEGEFWKDEIGAYRSYLRSQCREDAQ
jgi:tetratricopeptide (TPR) repeat protein